MAHTYTNILIHALFSTKDRQPWLTPEIREEAFCCLGGTLNELGGQSLLVNGPRDHVHMLFVQPWTLSIASVMETVKREFFEMGEGSLAEAALFRLAGRLCGLQR